MLYLLTEDGWFPASIDEGNNLAVVLLNVLARPPGWGVLMDSEGRTIGGTTGWAIYRDKTNSAQATGEIETSQVYHCARLVRLSTLIPSHFGENVERTP